MVVNEDEIGACDSLSFLDNGRGAINIKFLAEDARDSPFFVCAVTGNDQAVRTKCRPLREGFLQHSKFGDCPVIVDLDFGAKQSDACFFQPDSRPLLEIATRGLLEFVKKICQGGVLVGVLGQVFMQAREEVIASDVADQLAKNRCSLGVGDTVEVHLDIGKIANLGGNGVSGWELILVHAPVLAEHEAGPTFCVFGCFSQSQVTHEFSERLIEPQIVPPLHGD